MSVSRRGFLGGLAAMLLTPCRLMAKGAAACGLMKVDMFGPLDTPTAEAPAQDTSKPLPAAKMPTTASAQTYRKYNPVYDVMGDRNASTGKLANHLANHHGINTSGMTRDQMFMAHDRAHGVNVRLSTTVPKATTAVTYSSGSSCPNGQCPTSPSGRRSRR